MSRRLDPRGVSADNPLGLAVVIVERPEEGSRWATALALLIEAGRDSTEADRP